MECKTARLLLAVAPTDRAELDQEEAQALENHLQECAECAGLARDEQEAERCLGEAIRGVTPAPFLRDRIIQDLRCRRRKELRRRLAASTLAALVFFGTAFGSWWWVRSHLPMVTASDDAEETADLVSASADTIRNYFVETYRINVPMPSGLNYAWFQFCAYEEFRGRNVPCLAFIRGGKWARVRVLRADRFDLRPAIQSPEAGTRGISVVVRQSDDDPSVVYEILFNGDSLEWLTEKEPPSV
jgi:hypothetical protein